MNETLSPRERIRRKKDFIYLYREGTRFRGKYFNIIYLSNNLSFSRLGIVVGKKIGNSVVRNQMKRWMRTLFRRNKELLTSPVDMLILPEKKAHEASWRELEIEYSRALKNMFEKEQPQ